MNSRSTLEPLCRGHVDRKTRLNLSTLQHEIRDQTTQDRRQELEETEETSVRSPPGPGGTVHFGCDVNSPSQDRHRESGEEAREAQVCGGNIKSMEWWESGKPGFAGCANVGVAGKGLLMGESDKGLRDGLGMMRGGGSEGFRPTSH